MAFRFVALEEGLFAMADRSGLSESTNSSEKVYKSSYLCNCKIVPPTRSGCHGLVIAIQSRDNFTESITLDPGCLNCAAFEDRPPWTSGSSWSDSLIGGIDK